MSSWGLKELEPEPEGGLLRSLWPVLSLVAIAALVAGFSLGQFIQSQFAGVAIRSEMYAQAVDQFDDAVGSAEKLAANAQQNLKVVFDANGVSPDLPKPPEQKAEADIGNKEGSAGEAPQPAPTPAPAPPEPAIKALDQLREANQSVAEIRDRLDIEVEVPDDTFSSFSFFDQANATRKTHKVPVPTPKPDAGVFAGISLSSIILVGIVLFLAGLTIYSLRMYALAPSAGVRKLYERLSIALVTFFVLAGVGMFGTYLGVKIVLPSGG